MAATPPRLDLFAFLDAYGWEIARRFPILEEVAPHRARLRTVLGYSSAAVPTILSGRMPREHGHWSFFYYDPQRSPFRALRLLALLPRALTSRARVRNLISRWVKRWHGFEGYFQLYNIPFRHAHLFDYSEKKNFYERGGLNEGRTIFEELLDRELPFFCSRRGEGEAQSVARLEGLIASGSVPFAFLKLASLDTVIHACGVAAEETRARIADYERWILRLLDAAREAYREVRLWAFSDHGQVDVSSCHDLAGDLAPLGLVFGSDYVACYDSTLGRFWALRDGVRERLEARLAELDYGRVLSREEQRELGIDFEGNRYGETIFLMNPRALIVPSHMGERPVAAMHGYHPDDAGSDGILMSNAPIDPSVSHIRDLHRLMLESLESTAPRTRAAPAPRAEG